VPQDTAQAIAADNASARLNGLRAALSVLALLALLALAATRRLPTKQPGADEVQPEALGSEDLSPDAG
jgi:hypothetical protein